MPNQSLHYLFPWRHRYLIWQLIKHELQKRYKESFLGLSWLIIVPLLSLFIYTWVFQKILGLHWPNSDNSTINFAIRVMAGLSLFNWLAESLSRSPKLITDNVHLVKKVVFPLPILAWVQVLTCGVSTLITLLILIIVVMWTHHELNPILFLSIPLLIPFIYLLLGLVWLTSSLSVFLKDIEPLISIILSLTMFLSPIFYPLSNWPDHFHSILKLHVFAQWIEMLRSFLFGNNMPNVSQYLWLTAFSFSLAILSIWIFKKLEKEFADAL